MKAKFVRSYRSKKTGKTVFVYTVSGSKEQLAEYKEHQEDNFRESDDGKALWFTMNYCGENVSLILTSGENKRYIPDMSAYEKAASLSDQFDGKLGQELAKQAAALLLGNNAARPAAQTTQAAPQVEPEIPAVVPEQTADGMNDEVF